MKISLSQLIELYNGKRHEEVKLAIDKFLKSEPGHAHGWHLAAANAIQLGQLESALVSVEKACALMPQEIGFLNTQGSIYRQLGNLDQACGSYKRALQLGPDKTDTMYNLANLYRDMGEQSDAVGLYRRTLEIDAQFHAARLNLAYLLHDMADAESAEFEFRTLMTSDGGTLQALFGLGQAIAVQGRYDEAEACFRQFLQHAPDDLSAIFALGNALWSQGKVSGAESCHRRCVELNSEYYQAWNNLGNDLRDQGLQQEAIACYRKAIALNPGYMRGGSNLLLELNTLLEDGEQLLDEHRRWDLQHTRALFQPRQFNRQQAAGKVLRIGYLSSDFCHHSVAFFIEGVLKYHDAEQFHISCYSNLLKADAKTVAIRSLVDSWCEIGSMSDDEVADRIFDDGVDILIDLSGHTGHHRLGVFARKPAPIQMTYLGYPATTGMQAMDYRISDHFADPVGSDHYHSEAVLRLSRCFIAFTPYLYAPEVSALPVDEAGFIRFVSFNHLLKIGPDVIRLWARVLQAVPNSRLMVKHFSFTDEGVRERFIQRFIEQGISSDRIEVFAWAKKPEEHLKFYQRADIALDSFPYNGTTTTCESLWMGVPVVTLQGYLHAGRVGTSLMHSVDLDDLIAQDEKAYVEICRELAVDHVRLREIRSTLRHRMLESDLCDSQSMASALEIKYREVWHHWLDVGAGE